MGSFSSTAGTSFAHGREREGGDRRREGESVRERKRERAEERVGMEGGRQGRGGEERKGVQDLDSLGISVRQGLTVD